MEVGIASNQSSKGLKSLDKGEIAAEHAPLFVW